jgi:D-alanyl-D-alanine carboxypeptidase/D-alanyl-D-alanine-endopeptidase (penicillin-binding protein 4)
MIGVSVFDLSTDSSIIEKNDGLLFMPASNLKLFTSAAALELLGPNFRFQTGFCRRGVIDKKGTLKGDLVIRGGGDPLVSGRFRSSITEILDYWVDSLRTWGIKKIEGRIVVDNNFFEPPDLGPGWSWDDLSYWYACPASALSFNDNCVDLRFSPGAKVGDPAVIRFNPNTSYITTHNNAITLPGDSSFTLDYHRIPNTNDVTFFGGIPLNDTLEIDYVSVNRPDLYCATIFGELLLRSDLEVKEGVGAISDMDSTQAAAYSERLLIPLFTWMSDTLGVVLKVINTNSQNFFAEQTLRTLGATRGKEGSLKEGIGTVTDFLASIGITTDDAIMYDGSGLSYLNLVKPLAIIKLLRFMSRSPNFTIFYESLATPGKDKALGNRLKGREHNDQVRAKTGYIANVSTFSGYVRGPQSGHLLAFSIMVNHYVCPVSYVEAWEDSLISLLLGEF